MSFSWASHFIKCLNTAGYRLEVAQEAFREVFGDDLIPFFYNAISSTKEPQLQELFKTLFHEEYEQMNILYI